MPLSILIVSTITAPNSSTDNCCESNAKGAFCELILALILTVESNSLNPTTLIHAANGKPIFATSSGTLCRSVKSGVAQSLLPSLPENTWIPVAETEDSPTVKDWSPK